MLPERLGGEQRVVLEGLVGAMRVELRRAAESLANNETTALARLDARLAVGGVGVGSEWGRGVAGGGGGGGGGGGEWGGGVCVAMWGGVARGVVRGAGSGNKGSRCGAGCMRGRG